MLMKTNPLIIAEFLTAYSGQDALAGIKVYLTGGTEFASQKGWKVHGNDLPTDREYLRFPTDTEGVWEYWIQDKGIEGLVSDTPLAQTIPELTPEAIQFLKEEAERMTALMPECPKCGHKLNLMGVCSGCPKGNEGFKSKFTCECGYEEYFTIPVMDKYNELNMSLKEGNDGL